MMKKSLLALLFALLGLANAYADNQTVTVSAEDADKPLVLPSPKAGENLTVVVEVPVPTKKVAPVSASTPVVVEKESGVSLRGGIGYGYTYLLGNDDGGLALTTDLVGQIGFRSSPWRVRARAGFGDGRGSYDVVAVAGSVAAMRYVVPETLAVGVGFDLLGTIDQGSHPRETWNEQFYGLSVRVAVERSGLSLEVFYSAGVRETRAPGDTPEEYAITTGFNLSYLWGR